MRMLVSGGRVRVIKEMEMNNKIEGISWTLGQQGGIGYPPQIVKYRNRWWFVEGSRSHGGTVCYRCSDDRGIPYGHKPSNRFGEQPLAFGSACYRSLIPKAKTMPSFKQAFHQIMDWEQFVSIVKELYGEPNILQVGKSQHQGGSEKMTGYATTKYELGGIRHIEVRLPNRPAVTVARDDDHLTDAELVARATSYWQARDKQELVANTLKHKYPNRQVYIGALPTNDVLTALNGYYAYVLKDRKRQGKYQILDAISL